MRIKSTAGVIVIVATISVFAQAQTIPKEIWGKWRVRRQLATRTISCWGESDAKRIIGTEIEYSGKIFRWNLITTSNPIAEKRIVSAVQFRDENSSPSSNGSQVDFHQLGIDANEVAEISIHHEPASITGATTEIPGDDFLVKNDRTIVFSVCSLWFEAKRVQDTR